MIAPETGAGTTKISPLGPFTPREWLAIYAAKMRVTLAVQMQYRAALLVWLFATIFEPVVLLAVWTAVASAQGGSVQGFTQGDFAAYYIVGLVVNQATFSWIFWEFDYYIREGTLASQLLKPIHPIHAAIADNLGYKLLTAAVLVPTVLVLVVLFRPVWHFEWWALAAFFPALVGAFLVRFMLDYTLAMSAFWVTRVSALNHLYFVLFLFFSGRLAPLVLFPEAVQTLANVLPFRWTLSFPIELVLGQLEPRQVLLGFAAQAVWFGIGVSALSSAWRAGVRRFGAVGG